MPSPTIVVIGAGSAVFGLAFLQDMFQVPALRGAVLRLVDVDPAALERMRRVAEQLNEASGWDVRVEAMTDAEEALPGAGFVVVSVSVDRVNAWRLDHELALRHGFASVLSENAGPGGLSHTLRSVPLLLEIAQLVERLSPGALLLNYSNPANRVSLAVSRYTKVACVGLCHGVAGTRQWLGDVLGVPFQRLDIEVAGVNHFNWMTGLRDRETGTDLLPAFSEAVQRRPEDEWRLCRYVFGRVGVFPTTGDDHIGEFLPWAAEMLGTKGYDFADFSGWAASAVTRIEAWGRGAESVAPLLAERSLEGKAEHGAPFVIGDIVARATSRHPSFILPNEALIPDLPADGAIEVAGEIVDGELRGRPVPSLAPPARALVAREMEIQSLAVDAAVQGSRELALQALLLDPVVHSARAAEAFLEDVLQQQRKHLPRFWADG